MKARDAAGGAPRPWIEKCGSAGCLGLLAGEIHRGVLAQTLRRDAMVGVCNDRHLWGHWTADRFPLGQGESEALGVLVVLGVCR